MAVLGPRQCGKSTLVKNLRPDWNYYDLERPDDYQLITSDPQGFFRRRPEKTIIDEAQQYPKLFGILRSAIDADRSASGRYLLTGSSSPDIVKGLAESLAGRMACVELWPFKAGELYDRPLSGLYAALTGKKDLESVLEHPPSLTIDQIHEQWLWGGYPEPRIKQHPFPEFHGLWMDNYFAQYMDRDISQLFPGLNRHAFKLFIQALSFHSGHILNQSELSRAVEISSPTVKHYLEILHNTFVWRNLRSFEKNSLKKIQKMPKGFFRDSGILHHLLKLTETDKLLVHPAAGPSFESFMIEEVIRGFQSTLTSGLDHYFYRTKDKSEVDLVIEGHFGLLPIEIKLGHKIDHRKLAGLKNFMTDTKAPLGIVINTADKAEYLTDDIIQIPAGYW
ncbi:ATP-binding protein [Desulfoplanes sp.]